MVNTGFGTLETDLNFSADSLEDVSGNDGDKIIKDYSNRPVIEENESHRGVVNNCEKSKTNKNDDENQITIPFYSKELTLAELRKLQNSARKKVKLPVKPNNSSKSDVYNNNTTGYATERSSNDFYLPLDNISVCSTMTGSHGGNKYCSSETLENTRRLSRSQTTRSKAPVDRTRGKSVSYLEQYRKKVEKKNERQVRNESVCSTIGTSNSSCRTQISSTDILDTFSASKNDFHTESEESFYEDFINNKIICSSPKSLRCGFKDVINKRYNNLNNMEISELERELKSKIIEEDNKIEKILKGKVS